uniref:Uncharacterized protein n=1 Tax=Cacopsylla melanoneura TaxID=428564 RepID=A0A8D9AL00_9HEMI
MGNSWELIYFGNIPQVSNKFPRIEHHFGSEDFRVEFSRFIFDFFFEFFLSGFQFGFYLVYFFPNDKWHYFRHQKCSSPKIRCQFFVLAKQILRQRQIQLLYEIRSNSLLDHD